MSNQYDIATFADLRRFYGGAKGMERRFKLSQPGACHWGRRGIPGGWHLRIYLEVAAAGKTINPDLFDVDGELAGVMTRLVRPSSDAVIA